MKKYIIPIAALLLTTACTDNEFDLDNIDTTSHFEINNLTVPVNVKQIKLESILDLDDNDRIKALGNGDYAVVETGTFTTSAVSIKAATIKKPQISAFGRNLPVNVNIPDKVLEYINAAKALGKDLTVADVLKAAKENPEWNINEDTKVMHLLISDKAYSNAEFHAYNIDKNIESVEYLGINNPQLNVALTFTGLDKVVDKMSANIIELKLPQGFYTEEKTYNTNTGFWDPVISEISPKEGFHDKLTFHGIDFVKAGAKWEKNADGTHNISFSHPCYATGTVDITIGHLKPSASMSDVLALSENDNVGYQCSINFANDISVINFTGVVNYDVESMHINPINLSSIPDFLRQKGTKIVLDNPQIYLRTNNPIASTLTQDIKAHLTLQPTNAPTGTFTQNINLPAGKADVSYCYSPKNPESYFKGVINGTEYDYSDSEWNQFANLGYIIAPQGNSDVMPDEIAVAMDVEKIHQRIENFEIRDYGSIKGEYTFVAPVEMTSEAVIAYADTIDGWHSDLEGLVVKLVNISADVTSDIPVNNVNVEIHPVTINPATGVQTIDTSVIGTARLAANGTSGQRFNHAPLAVTLEGNITDIDGVYVKLRIDAAGQKTLNKTETVKLENIKITVSGSYDKKL